MACICVIDDQAMMRDSLAATLAAADHKVSAFDNAQEALTLIKQQSCDVVLTDLRMPNLDGLKATRRISEQHNHPCVLIVAMTWDKPFVCRAMENGARGYVAKSEIFQELVPAVRALFRGETYYSGSVAETLADKTLGDCRN